MRCSSSEAHLDAYVDGTLLSTLVARLETHLAACDRCRALASDLRAIDAVLFAPRVLEPNVDLTVAVMAEVRTLARPHVRRASPLAILGVYVVFAWVTIAGFLVWGGAAARAMLATLGESAAASVAAGGTLAMASARLFGHHTFDVTAAMGALLALDIVVAAALVWAFAHRHKRFAALEAC